jgi:heme/copper-type cytochrome/quinol oxidase subunit 3
MKAFLALRAIEWTTSDFKWNTDVHGSIFYAILFLHTVDLVGDLVYAIFVIARGNHGGMQRVGVHVDTVVW